MSPLPSSPETLLKDLSSVIKNLASSLCPQSLLISRFPLSKHTELPRLSLTTSQDPQVLNIHKSTACQWDQVSSIQIWPNIPLKDMPQLLLDNAQRQPYKKLDMNLWRMVIGSIVFWQLSVAQFQLNLEILYQEKLSLKRKRPIQWKVNKQIFRTKCLFIEK